MKTKIKVKSTSFEINKLITTTQLFSSIKLSLSARLVLRCIVDYWNYKIGCAYPTQATIAKCTGLTEVAVGNAVKELDEKGLVDKKKQRKRIYYYFTLKFLGYLKLTPKIIYVDTQKNFSNIPQQCLDKNILKNNENIPFSNSSIQEITDGYVLDDELAYAKTMIANLSQNPIFAKKVDELKKKYQL